MSLKKRINYLNKVKAVQEEFSKYDDGGRVINRIHDIWIKPKFNISFRTLYRYFDVNVKKELKKLEDIEKETPQ